ncbi:uncharacterized protein [Paramormyrops kingsleyae]|uniref:uncharacterized protein isoform X2 n=1 Tax=Paramormyrops kingsleyae TaxID=1676925 RepID=UPI003B97B2D5
MHSKFGGVKISVVLRSKAKHKGILGANIYTDSVLILHTGHFRRHVGRLKERRTELEAHSYGLFSVQYKIKTQKLWREHLHWFGAYFTYGTLQSSCCWSFETARLKDSYGLFANQCKIKPQQNINIMLLKVQYQHHKKYIKLTGSSYDSVIKDVKQKFDISTDHKVFLADETGTEVDEDVFADIIEQKPDTLWMVIDAVAVTDSPAHTSYPSSNETDAPSLHSVASSSDTQPSDSDGPFFPPKRTRSDDHLQEAKELVKSVLEKKPAGEKILQEYKTTGKITDSTRRILVNALVGDMIDKYGSIPPKEIRVKYAVGIVTLFPSLKDPFSRKGYEHFYDAEGNSGYIAWRLKTVQRNNRCSRTTSDDKCERRGPRTERVFPNRKAARRRSLSRSHFIFETLLRSRTSYCKNEIYLPVSPENDPRS